MSDRLVDYQQAWAWQRALVERTIAEAEARREALQGGGGEAPGGVSVGCVLLLQHPPVLTLGTGSTLDNLRFRADQEPPVPLYRTERGGEVTYHGPGQLVMYPILDLRSLQPDLHWYLRQLEQVVIEALDAVSGLQGQREPGLTGVWVDGAKVAAIGVRAKKWVSYHGLALNVAPDLRPFGLIVPCGISDRPVSSVQLLLQQQAARAAAELDPFLSPAAELPPQPEMLLAEASQDDLRRMLLQAGGPLPPVVDDSLAPAQLRPGRQPHAAATQQQAAEATADLSVHPFDPFEDPFAPGPDLETRVEEGVDLEGLDVEDPFAPAPAAAASPGAPLQPTAGGLPAAATPSGAAAGGTGSDLGGGRGGAGLCVDAQVLASAAQARSAPEEVQLLREYSAALLEALGGVFGLCMLQGDPRVLQRAPPPAP